jgi:hypothetical protein
MLFYYTIFVINIIYQYMYCDWFLCHCNNVSLLVWSLGG